MLPTAVHQEHKTSGRAGLTVAAAETSEYWSPAALSKKRGNKLRRILERGIIEGREEERKIL